MIIFEDQIENATKDFFFIKIFIPINTEGYKEAYGVAISILSLTFFYIFDKTMDFIFVMPKLKFFIRKALLILVNYTTRNIHFYYEQISSLKELNSS